jgi:hypothetical protein
MSLKPEIPKIVCCLCLTLQKKYIDNMCYDCIETSKRNLCPLSVMIYMRNLNEVDIFL